MKNVKIWRQGAFGGGINTASPPTQLEENQLVDVLNMFPNDKGSELMLRSAFLEDDGYESGLEYDHLFGSRIITADGTIVDGLIAALQESGVVKAYALLPSPYVLDTDESGTDAWVPPVVPPKPIPSNMTTWDEILTEVLKNPESLANDLFTGARDFWLNDELKFQAESDLLPYKNASKWLSKDYPYDVETAATTFYDGWYVKAENSQKIACDTWLDEDSTIQVFTEVDGVAPEKFLGVKTPWWRRDEQISGSNTVTNPVMVPPAIEFLATVPVNCRMSFCFDYDTGFKGISVQVFVKNSKDANAEWTPVNVKNNIQLPLVLDDQSILNVDERYLGTGDLDEFIVCSKVIPYPDVAVRIEFIPSRIDPDNVNTGGLFIGYHTAAQ